MMGFSPGLMNSPDNRDKEPSDKKVRKQKERNRMLIPYADDDIVKKDTPIKPPQKIKSWKLLFGILIIAAILYETYWFLKPYLF